MRELGFLLTSWLVCANSQIIFPDQFEMLQKSQAIAAQVNSSLPPVSTSVYAAPQATDNTYVNDVREIEGSSSTASAAASAASEATTSQGSESVDVEALYWSNHVNNLIARGVTKFALDMDRAIHRTRGTTDPSARPNVIFSPLSLVGTLAMVLLGSAGMTFDEVARILGLEAGVDISGHSEIVHQMFGMLLDSVDARSNSLGPQVTMANGIFVQNGYPIRSEFKAISQYVYKNEVINLDFIGHRNEATNSVNDWVKARTRGKISNILSQQVDPDTRLIIASALYFSGEWNQHFLTAATKRKPFAITPTQSVMVDMMYSGGDFPFYEDKQLGVKIIGLPYKGYDLASSTESAYKYQATMYVMLPTTNTVDALTELESRLTPARLEDIISKMVNQSCILGLPRMKLSSTLNLNQALESLGLTSLFDASTSNLGLLSPGYNNLGKPTITDRIGGGDETSPHNPGSRSTGSVDPTKKNYIRYEDKRGGYSVEQWSNGLILQKIHRRPRSRRSEDGKDAEESGPPKKVRSQRWPIGKSKVSQRKSEMYELPINMTSDGNKINVVALGEDKYKFQTALPRQKRQSRPMADEFIRFVESRERFPKFGLDALRNSPNLENPGLFASDVLHKVEIEVTETGTVGAAATTVTLQRSGGAKRLLANRPFLFFIRHEPSRLMLFWGTVYKPTPNY